MAVLLQALVAVAMARPGPPGLHQVSQPDGTQLQVRYVGDCWNPRVEDADGYTLYGTAVADGVRWELAERVGDRLAPTGWLAGSIDPRALGLTPHLRGKHRPPPRRAPAGAWHGGLRGAPLVPAPRHTRPLVILVDFDSGTPGALPDHQYTAAQFADLLFAEGLVPGNQGLPSSYTVSMRDYFDGLSGGQFVIEGDVGDVVDWVVAPQGYNYYVDGQQGLGNYPKNAAGLLHDVAPLVDAAVDFSQYDADGDGAVDHVILVAEGWADGANNKFWPHASRTTEPLTLDGVTLEDYLLVTEAEFFSDLPLVRRGDPMPLGTFAHELGHILGIPDLYDTDNSSSGAGQWDLMSHGASFSPVRPAAMGAWTRTRLGWVEPDDAPGGSSTTSLDAVSQGGGVTRIWADPYMTAQYFLLENRQQTGIDADLAGDGMLIWRVDERTTDAFPISNTVNASDNRYGAGVIQADGSRHLERGRNLGDAGDPYPGSSNNRSLTDATTPSSETVGGQPSGIEVTSISGSGPTMTADIAAPELAGFTLGYDDFAGDWVGSWGSNYVEVHFTPEAEGVVDAVRIWVWTEGVAYDMWFFEADAAGTPGRLLWEGSGTLGSEGWNVEPMSEVVSVRGDMVVRMKLSGQSPIAYDASGIIDGRSRWGPDGLLWEDLNGDANLRLLIGTRVDHDGDGFTPETGDCDEARADALPGGTEVCNGEDDNCDGALTADDQLDQDGDFLADCVDDDRDGDGIANADDADPDDPDVLCGDADGDTCDDCAKVVPADPSNDGPDKDDDGICNPGDVCDGDDASGDYDGDGTCDDRDPPPAEPEPEESGVACGCAGAPGAPGGALLGLIRRR